MIYKPYKVLKFRGHFYGAEMRLKWYVLVTKRIHVRTGGMRGAYFYTAAVRRLETLTSVRLRASLVTPQESDVNGAGGHVVSVVLVEGQGHRFTASHLNY